jgi:hypothetical protein
MNCDVCGCIVDDLVSSREWIGYLCRAGDIALGACAQVPVGTLGLDALTSREYEPRSNTNEAPKGSKRFMSETSQMHEPSKTDSSRAAVHERRRGRTPRSTVRARRREK